jgi:hypothetical protein
MGKLRKISLMALSLIMAILAVGCVEDLTRDEVRGQSQEVIPPTIYPLELKFNHTFANHETSYETEWITTESRYNIREVCPMLAQVSHKNDRYAVADKYRNVSADYSNAHMSASDVAVKTSGTAMKSEFKYTQRFTAEEEDGNLLYLDWEATRIAIKDTIENKMVYLPFDSIVSAKIKSIEALPGDTKYKTRGETYVSDSIVRKVTWEITRVPVGAEDADEKTFELVDMFKVLLLSSDDIEDAYAQNIARVIIDATTERCSFDEIFKMKSGEEHTNPHNIILTREIITIPEWELIVKNTAYTHSSMSQLARGAIKTVSEKDNWTVREQIDEISSTAAAQGENNIVFPYKFRHQGAKYKDEYGVEVDFALIPPSISERNTWVENAESPKGGYSAKRVRNAVATSYLEYAQDATESALLLVENVHSTSEGWKTDECKETIKDNEVIWTLIYVINYSDGTQQRIPFEFKDGRSLVPKSDWNSIEKNTNHSTSGVSVKAISTDPQSNTQNEATAKWNRVTSELTSVATLNGSKQENKWVSVEPTDVSVTYRDKTHTFAKNTIKASNTDNVGSPTKDGNDEVSKYSAILSYTWGSNTKNSTAPGTIRVNGVVVTSEDWDKTNCTETITENQVIWKLLYVINYSDGHQDKIPFNFNDSRSLVCESDWISIESNTNHSTSGVSVNTVSTDPKSETQNGATAKWNRIKSALSSVVTLNASKQENKWTSVEPTDFSVTYRNKSFSFEKNSIRATNTDNVASATKNGDYEESKYTALLNYVWGNNTRTSTGPGTIRVKVAAPEPEKTFFPPEWGSLYEAKQTLSNDRNHKKFVYIWSLHFEKGVLPVVVTPGSSPDWHFEYFEYTSDHSFNSAVWQKDEKTWVNAVASDPRAHMLWSRNSVELANKDRNVAESEECNWDEGHRGSNGRASVFTSRYNLDVTNGRLTATDTYKNIYLGSWK